MSEDLRTQIAEAIQKKDRERLKELQIKLQQNAWLHKFNGNVPIMAWLLEPNPFVEWKE
jgi:hypothetical protein